MVSIKEEDEEDEEPHTQQQNHIHHHHYSEEEEAKPEMESESSPLRSPIQSHSHSKSFSKHHPEPLQSINSQPHENLSQIIAMDRQIHGFSPLRSPPSAAPPQNHNNNNNNTKKKRPIRPPPPLPLPLEPTPTPMESVQVNPLSPVIVVNRSIREDLSVVSKMDPGENGFPGGAPPPPGAGGGSRRVRSDVEYGDRRSRRVSSILYQERKEARLKRAALGFRVCEAVFCLISFSVMAADKTQGWAGDSFDRYKEYRYCLSVTVIGFAYAGFQAFDLAYNLVSGTHVMQDHIRIYSDFFMDQVLTYLLISASSAAASRVDEWQSNWGKDEFTIMASASIGMSFLAFVAFAFSSLISGHNLCTYNSQT